MWHMRNAYDILLMNGGSSCSSTETLAVHRIRRIIWIEWGRIECGVRWTGKRWWYRCAWFSIRMISGGRHGAERWCWIATMHCRCSKQRAKRMHHGLLWLCQSGSGCRRVTQIGSVCAKVLQQFIGIGEPFAAVWVAGNPVAYQWTAQLSVWMAGRQCWHGHG